jgi:alanine racemase
METATAIINSKALVNNYEYLKKISGTDVMGVLKANAYGHGAVGVARILRRAGMAWFGVATVGEAVALREAGDNGRILAWLYQVDPRSISQAIEHDIDLAIFDASQIKAIALLVGYERKLRIHLHLDTGMSRGGISPADALTAAAVIAAEKNLTLVGCFTHLVSSELPDQPVVTEQLAKFREIKTDFNAAGITDVLFHIANSGGAINYDVSDFDFVRSGISLYGIDPADKPNDKLSAVMRLIAPVIQLKTLTAITGVGYGHTYMTQENQRVALVPIGYADGVPRTASGNAEVMLNKTMRKVLGTISMDQIVIEALPTDAVGDEVTIFGDPAHGYPSVLNLAHAAGNISYEVLVRIGERVVRSYV